LRGQFDRGKWLAYGKLSKDKRKQVSIIYSPPIAWCLFFLEATYILV